ncbi:MAG: biosynthetic arginine decarboxylase [Candidatus Thorarchaeota archaeon]
MRTRILSNESNWSIEKAKYIYGIGQTSEEFHYLDISEDGNLLLSLPSGNITITEIINTIRNKGISSFVLRIPELIKTQIEKLYSAFDIAIDKYNYGNKYQGVFPVKVNQTQTAIRSIQDFGGKFHHGFEVGTKPELLIAVSNVNFEENTLIICNGTKDEDYLTACLVLSQSGYNIIISVESIDEINLLLKVIEKTSVLPQIGLRVKLLQQVPGHWGNSSGRFSKFGLSSENLIKVVDKLKENNILDKVKLIHGHIGSQIGNKIYFQRATTELIGIYINLWISGVSSLTYLNLGGGLGIDYIGNNTNSDSGTSYSFFQYADTIVKQLTDVLLKYPNIPPPFIITESGRAITAHSGMLCIEILEKREITNTSHLNLLKFNNTSLSNIWYMIQHLLSETASLEELNNAIKKIEQKLDTIISDPELWLTKNGRIEYEQILSELDLNVRSKFRNIYFSLPNNFSLSKGFFLKYPYIKPYLCKADTHLVGNFSVFNGACDVVLVDQYFPVYPTTHLNQKPDSLMKLVDITCDSDGEINQYYTANRRKQLVKWMKDDHLTNDYHLMLMPNDSQLIGGFPLSNFNSNKGQYLVVGCTGAYQSTVYFDQNLLGRLPEITIRFNEVLDEYVISIVRNAEISAELLSKMNHSLLEVTQNLPNHHIVDSLLYSSPYVINKDNERVTLSVLSEQLENILLPPFKEEPISNIIINSKTSN